MFNNSESKSENKEINMQNNSSLSLMDKIISDIKSNKSNNNESVLKMLNISINKQDESDGILKILSVAIFHKNKVWDMAYYELPHNEIYLYGAL